MGGMAGKECEDVREEDITGLKYFDELLPLFAQLHKVGCQRDNAGNRRLHYDQYVALILLLSFQPRRDVASRVAAGQRAQEHAAESEVSSGVARLTERGDRSLRAGVAPGNYR